MADPHSQEQEIAALPPTLRALLKAELAAGNVITEIGHSFPAPPVGAYFMLGKPLLTRANVSNDGLSYTHRNHSSYSGEITDGARFYFLLEPPLPPTPPPDMDAIRQAHLPADPQKLLGATRPTRSATEAMNPPPSPPLVTEDPRAGIVQSFLKSMEIDYEKWHDGIGYDLSLIARASPEDRAAIEQILLTRSDQTWREIEALAELDTPRARRAMKAAMKSGNHEIRSAVMAHAPTLVSDAQRTKALLEALRSSEIYTGLSPAIDQIAEFHPPKIVAELFRSTLERNGDIAVHLAALLLFIFGRAPTSFDWEQRPFFLRFNTNDRAEREAVFRELCAKIGSAADPFLPNHKAPQANKSIPPNIAVPALGVPIFTVDLDLPAGLMIYREPARIATATCVFGKNPRLAARSLRDWTDPVTAQTTRMKMAEKRETLARIADYCRNRHGLLTLTIA